MQLSWMEIDIDGTILETPCEPPASKLKEKYVWALIL